MKPKTIVLIALTVLGYNLYQHGVTINDIKHQQQPLSGIQFKKIPEQSPTNIPPFTANNHTITPLARFTIRARVLSVEQYRFDRAAVIAPVDLALAWGRMADPMYYERMEVSQSGRWYFYHWAGEPPLPQQEILESSANMHMIPANDAVRNILKHVRRHQMVRLKGFLVEVNSPDGWRWRSSLRRDDSGDGACEVVYVEAIDIEAN
ncbi:MAG TPA: hypothetical protein VGE55_02470 [Limnobacter sp.]|uniref:hypothetical protein n=1 Tax=Limnobacter sp. TaxID=2003368 RepID=UPI002EDB6553